MQKLISFDIGIKNMAFCLFDMESSPPSIQKWDVLNLMDINDNVQPVCNCYLKSKNKKKGVQSSPKVCNKKAKYEKNGQYYCEKHAIEQPNLLIPNKEHSPAALKKMKKDALLEIAEKYCIFRSTPKSGTLDTFYQQGSSIESTIIPTTIKGLLEKYWCFLRTNVTGFSNLQKRKQQMKRTLFQ